MNLAAALGLWLALFISSIGSAQSYTTQDVNCLRGGCLENGWSIYDYRSGQSLLVQCIDGSCNDNGWTEDVLGGGVGQRAICDEGGCFYSGWMTRQLGTGRFVGETRCRPSREPVDAPQENCFINGWTATPAWGPSVSARCIEDDCREFGWQIWAPDGTWVRARCKPGGCFERGWTIEQR